MSAPGIVFLAVAMQAALWSVGALIAQAVNMAQKHVEESP